MEDGDSGRAGDAKQGGANGEDWEERRAGVVQDDQREKREKNQTESDVYRGEKEKK